VIAIFAWLMDFIRGLRKREKRTVLARLARLSASLFGLFYLYSITNFTSVFTDINPAFGVLNIFYGMPENFGKLFAIPTLIAALGLIMLVFSAIAWVQHFWTAKSRVFYSILTIFALLIVWSLYFWNLLL